MFDFVRKHTKIMMVVMFLLIIPSFVLFGLDGYNRMKEKGEVVAKVDGRDILQTEWDVAHKNEVDRMRSSMPSLDPKLADSPEARYASLERIVRDRVLQAAAGKSHLVTGDQRLMQELQSNEAIASLRQPDGKLDMDQYRRLVGAQGMTPEMFENEVRADLARRQVLQGVTTTGIAATAPANVLLGTYFERREVQLARFEVSAFAAKITPTDAEIETFYKNNLALFQSPERASIEYVVLDVDNLRDGITVSEQDLQAYYKENAGRLAGQEERRASHILINAPKSAPAAEREKARAKAQELLAAVRKAPDSFAEVAKKNSQDPGSAPAGGDLDYFARGAMVKPFEDAVFAMKTGEISDVVESDFGFHIIKLTDIRSPKQRSFEEMRAELESDIKKQQAQRKFAESAEAFTNGVYEQADSLKPTADRLKLKIQVATDVTRKPPPGVTGVLANPKFINALFSPDSIEKKRNTEAVEVAANRLVSGRITQYTPARTLPLAEVKELARQHLVTQRGAEMAKKEGAEKLAAWKAAPQSAVLPAAITVSREDPQMQRPQVIDAILRADAASLPAFVGVDLGPQQGYVVAKVNKVVAREAVDPATAAKERSQYDQWWASAEGIAYYNLLKERFKVQIKVPKPVAKAAGEAPPAQ
ncbi:MAG: SurA N-terminal domain-containing protein [Ramlibacter sp.]